MKKLGHLVLVIGVVLGVLLSACAPKAAITPSPAPSPSAAPAPTPSSALQLSEWDKVLAAARQEGTVTVYNSLGADLSEAFKVGMKSYGIKVESVGGTASELVVRIGTEQQAKAYSVDLFVSAWTNAINLLKNGQVRPVNVDLPALGEKNVWKIDPSKYDPTKSVFVYATAITPSVIINTDLVKKGEITSWQDLLDPKWRDRIVMSDGRTGSGPGATGLAFWMTLGDDFWKKMAAQRITL